MRWRAETMRAKVAVGTVLTMSDKTSIEGRPARPVVEGAVLGITFSDKSRAKARVIESSATEITIEMPNKFRWRLTPVESVEAGGAPSTVWVVRNQVTPPAAHTAP